MQLINLAIALCTLISFAIALPAAQFEVGVHRFEDAHEFNTTKLEARQGGHFMYWPSINNPNQILGPPYCFPQQPMAGNICMLTNRMPDGNPDWLELYLYDHNCVLIGINTHVPYSQPFDFDSQLPYVVVIQNIQGGPMGFAYGSDQWSDKGNDNLFCYNSGRAGANNLQPACQMEFQC